MQKLCLYSFVALVAYLQSFQSVFADTALERKVLNSQIEFFGSETLMLPIQLGDLEVGKTYGFTLVLKNATDSPLKIVEASPQCGCTKFSIPPTTIQAKDSIAVDFALEADFKRLPSELFNVQLQTEGAVTSVTLGFHSNISGALGFLPFRSIYRASPMRDNGDAAEIQEFKVPIIFSDPITEMDIQVSTDDSLDYLSWRFLQENENWFVVGSCRTDQIPPESSSGMLRLSHRQRPQQIAEQHFVIEKPEPVEFAPTRILLSRSSENDFWTGSGFVRIEAAKFDAKELASIRFSVEPNSDLEIVTTARELSKAIHQVRFIVKKLDAEDVRNSDSHTLKLRVAVGEKVFTKALQLTF